MMGFDKAGSIPGGGLTRVMFTGADDQTGIGKILELSTRCHCFSYCSRFAYFSVHSSNEMTLSA